MPELTHFLGPAIDAGHGNAANRGLKQYQITRELLALVTPCSGFYHKLHRGVSDTLAFEDSGCTTMVQFTYEIAPKPEAEIWRTMRDKTRNVIRRAGERWQVVTLDDPDAFSAMYEANLRSRGLVNHQRRIPAVCAAALAHNQGHVLAVRDDTGAALGAIFVAWDHESAYYLLATRALASDNGVMSLLVWDAIRDATARGLMFDFDGLGTPGSRLFYTGFGGQIAPRYIASRYSVGHRIAGVVTKAFAAPWA
jgi:predicted nucleic acid-binding protein